NALVGCGRRRPAGVPAEVPKVVMEYILGERALRDWSGRVTSGDSEGQASTPRWSTCRRSSGRARIGSRTGAIHNRLQNVGDFEHRAIVEPLSGRAETRESRGLQHFL